MDITKEMMDRGAIGRITTGQVSRVTGIPQQTLIAWDRDGVLKAARPGRRASKRSPRNYDESALTAALFAGHASRMGFKGDALRQTIALVQRGERKPLEAAAIFTYRAGPGLMTHVFTPAVESDDEQRHLAFLRERNLLVDEPTRLWAIREHLLPRARSLIRLGPTAMAPGLMEKSE
jgi:DNA-binding transcriptional MerR regulator